jgi:uncharacterized protein (TIGR03437 family)
MSRSSLLGTTFSIFFILILLTPAWAQTQSTGYTIDTVAGSEPPRDATLAVATWLDFPAGVAVDDAGNVYVSDTSGNRVLRVRPDGIRETFAGTGSFGVSGDGGPATEARLASPAGLSFGPDGSLYVTNRSTPRIRKIAPDGTITTVAGTGGSGFGGDGGPATEAMLSFPTDVAVDTAGNLYIADADNDRVRRVDPQGMISTFAGTGERGFDGDGGPAGEAQLNFPQGVAIGPAGEVLIADTTNHRIRVVDTDGNISTFAGGGNSTQDGAPTDYRLSFPNSIAVDATGVVYISNLFGNNILRSTTDLIETLAGTGEAGFSGDDGPAADALLNGPQGIAVSAENGDATVYFGDRNNHRVRAVTAGTISTVAGTAHLAGDGGPATEALLDTPVDVALDAAGNLYIAEWFNSAVRRVSPDGTITTVAGTGISGSDAPGQPAVETRLRAPFGVLIHSNGDLLIADTDNAQVLRVGQDGIAQLFAGRGSGGDGVPATEARLRFPVGLAEDSQGGIYISERFDHRIRRVGPDMIIQTFVGTGDAGFSGDGGPATGAMLDRPQHLVIDGEDTLFVVDGGNGRIRRITPGGLIDTIAGGGATFVDTEDVPALEGSLGFPVGLVMNPTGEGKGLAEGAELLISSSARVYRLNSEGNVRTIAGGPFRFSGDGGPAIGAGLASPSGMAIDADGNIYIADSNNDRVRKLTPVVTRVNSGGVVNGGAIAFSLAVDTVSPDMIASIFGIGLSIADGDGLTLPLPTTLAGVTVSITDSEGVTRLAPLFAARSTQINCLIPAGTAPGSATLTVTTPLGTTSAIDIEVVALAPGLFAINGGGLGLAAASAFLRDNNGVDTPLQVFNPAGFPFEPLPLDLGADTDLVVLSLFGTGIRDFTGQITATIGGVNAQVLGFAPSVQFVGLDQLNLLIPRSLIGAGVVEIQVTVDGLVLNTVTITIL